jgi:nucleoside 2-deoxyribosyltransferase
MSRPRSVYLAGPISGLSYGESVDWRDNVKAALSQHGIKAFSPMRSKEYLKGVRELDSSPVACEHYGTLSCLSSPRGITTRDRFDATNCGVLLVNLLSAQKVSIGTVMEIAWADAVRTPIVLVMEPHGNCHDHCMLVETVGFRVGSIKEAVSVVRAIFD